MSAHPIPRDALKESMAIVGRTGSGKSFAARGAVELLLTEGERVSIIDPTGVWWGLRSSADGRSPGFPIVVFGGDHADVPLDMDGDVLAELIALRQVNAVIDVSELTRSARSAFMRGFLEHLYATNRRPLTLVVDEADLFAPQRTFEPEQATILNRMEQIVRRGRTRGFRPWLLTQRPAELHKSVLSQANTLVAMQLTAPHDRKAIGAWIEGQADADEGKRVLAELPKLERGEAWIWSPSHSILQRGRFPKISTFDSMRTPEPGEEAPVVEIDVLALDEIQEWLRGKAKASAPVEKPEARKARRGGEVFEVDMTTALSREYERGRARAYVIARESVDACLPALRRAIAAATQTLQELEAAMTLFDRAVEVRQDPAAAAPESPTSVAKGNGSPPQAGDLSGAQRRILTALAQHPDGLSKAQLAILTGYAKRGGSFSNAIGSMRGRGLLVGDTERYIITSAGVAELGTFEPLPTGAALREHWLRTLGSKVERKTLEALCDAYPRRLSKQQIANLTGYEARGGSFNNAIYRLRSLELVQGKAELKASDNLFG